MNETLFEVIDASGAGCCRLAVNGTIVAASRNFSRLVADTGTVGAEVVGRQPEQLLAGLPELAALPSAITSEAAVIVRSVDVDGIGRELAVARIPDPTGGILVVVDRSGEGKLRRSEARLGRQIDDLEAELAARERQRRRPPIRSIVELATRLDEALSRARRYEHSVSVVAIQLGAPTPASIAETLLACIRGVDEIGRGPAGRWFIVLPHTELIGGEIVGRRVLTKLRALGVEPVGVGVAQVGTEEPGSEAVERADQVCVQALDAGGGLLLAVALV